MSTKHDPKVYANNIKFIDPISCGSTVGYTIYVERYGGFYGTLHLSDCTRKIEWSFDEKPESLHKIDEAINMLSEFRKELWKAQKQFPKDYPKEDKKKSGVLKDAS